MPGLSSMAPSSRAHPALPHLQFEVASRSMCSPSPIRYASGNETLGRSSVMPTLSKLLATRSRPRHSLRPVARTLLPSHSSAISRTPATPSPSPPGATSRSSTRRQRRGRRQRTPVLWCMLRRQRRRAAQPRLSSSTASGASWTTTSCGRLMQLPPLCLVLVVSDVVMMMLLHRISSCNWQKSILSKCTHTVRIHISLLN